MTHTDFLHASQPALRDLRGCEEWLARAALSDSRLACQAFISLLDDLEDAPPRHADYLRILERLREPILIAQEEGSRRFASRPLPLGHLEAAAFTQACDLWLALLRAYRRLLRMALKGTRPELAVSTTLLAERAVELAGELIGTHLLARREVSEDLWHWLHAAYALAERLGVADVPVAEPGSRQPPVSTCSAAYARPLLLSLAQPYGLREKDLNWVRRWTHRWGQKLRIRREMESSGAYAVDLTAPAGPVWREPGSAAESIRYLVLAEVAYSIGWRMKRLDEGVSPAELGLGRDCVQPAAGELLKGLLAAWTRPPKSRQFPRRTTHTTVEIIAGLDQICAALGGDTAAARVRPWHYSRRDADQIHVFQRAVERTNPGPRPVAEQWEMLDESANGFRLRRRAPGERLAHRQLVALRPSGAQRFILCELRWLIQDADAGLTVGTRAIVGDAQPVLVRPLGTQSVQGAAQALLVPVARDLPASLLLPAGWHQPGRQIELRGGGNAQRLQLTALIGRGQNFDHVRFEPLT